jgi:hypothetical protein
LNVTSYRLISPTPCSCNSPPAAAAAAATARLQHQQHVMCAFHLRHPSGQITRLLKRHAVVVGSSMGANKPQHRPVATAPANQLEQALGAIELLGSLQEPTLQQQVPDIPVTGMLLFPPLQAQASSLASLGTLQQRLAPYRTAAVFFGL